MKRAQRIFIMVFGLPAFLLLNSSCSKEDSAATPEATEVNSCAITATQGTMDVSGCWELDSPKSASTKIKTECEDGSLGGTAGTFSAAKCADVATGVPYCKDFAVAYGGKGSLYYTGQHYVDSGVDTVSDWCTQQKGTSGTQT
jgi:hypothetical protein